MNETMQTPEPQAPYVSKTPITEVLKNLFPGPLAQLLAEQREADRAAASFTGPLDLTEGRTCTDCGAAGGWTYRTDNVGDVLCLDCAATYVRYLTDELREIRAAFDALRQKPPAPEPAPYRRFTRCKSYLPAPSQPGCYSQAA